jgi:hypothetical protein
VRRGWIGREDEMDFLSGADLVKRRAATRAAAWLLTALLLLTLLSCTSSEPEMVLPADGFVAGWVRDGALQLFPGQELYGHIDGGAELFHEFGFRDLRVQRYTHGPDELALKIYRMTSPEAALGIYLMKTGAGVPHPDIPARNTANRFQLTMLQGDCFVQVNNFAGADSLVPIAAALGRAALAALPADEPGPLLARLPQEGLVPGSERLVRGPFALEPVYTFGSGDVLQLGGRVFGVLGTYRDDRGEPYRRLVIDYSSAKEARAAFDHLLANLDPHLEIVARAAASFTFRDYRDLFGKVGREGRTLEITLDLDAAPALQ